MTIYPPQKWNKVADILPQEGVLVRTVSPNGLEQVLKRSGRLWFFADGSMYVYYTPSWWLPLEKLK